MLMKPARGCQCWGQRLYQGGRGPPPGLPFVVPLVNTQSLKPSMFVKSTAVGIVPCVADAIWIRFKVQGFYCQMHNSYASHCWQ